MRRIQLFFIASLLGCTCAFADILCGNDKIILDIVELSYADTQNNFAIITNFKASEQRRVVKLSHTYDYMGKKQLNLIIHGLPKSLIIGNQIEKPYIDGDDPGETHQAIWDGTKIKCYIDSDF